MRRISLAHLALILLLSACTPENREAAAPAALPTAVAPPAASAAAAHPSDEHAQHHGATSGAKLERPPGGGNWPTDAALRQGMETIHVALAVALPKFEKGEFSAADATTLAGVVSGQVQFLVANCKLEPDADAQLHIVIGQMMSAAEAMLADAGSDEGVPKLHAAVQLYGEYFEHPGLHEHGGEPQHAGSEPDALPVPSAADGVKPAQ